MSAPRIIKKYPNRRLYDTVESRYITLAEIRTLVIEKADFVVIDKKTNEDITRGILLQVITEQEHGEPMMSQDFLSQVIRSYGSTMQNFVGNYLENSLRMFSSQQQQMRERMQTTGNDPFATVATLAKSNMEFWQNMQNQFFKNMAGRPPGTGQTAEPELEPEDSEQNKPR